MAGKKRDAENIVACAADGDGTSCTLKYTAGQRQREPPD